MTHQRPRAPRGTGLWLVPVLLFLAALAACGGKTAPPAPPPPPPTIISFQAAKSLVTVGKETTLTALYSDGKGVVDPGVGAIPAGSPVSTGPLMAHTTFTLRVDGPGGTASKTVDVKTVAPPAVPIITVAPSVTADTLATASVPPQEGCTFAWTISGGTFSGPDTGSTVDFRVGTGNFVQLYCVAVNAAGTDSRPGLALCTISTVPVQPVITAPQHVTAGQVGCTASVPASLTFACQWTIQGGTITAGARSNVVTFTAGTSGVVELKCTLTSAAGVTSEPGVARCLIVPAPTQPVIQAPPFAVANSKDNLASVMSQDGCTFLWTVAGGTLTSGDTSSSIRFSAGASGGVNLSCVAVNATGLRSQPATAYTPIVTAPPKPTLTAPAIVTANQPGYTASVPAVAGYGYEWTIQGGTITGSPSAPSITFTPGSGSLVELTCAWRDSRGLMSPAGSAKCTILPVPATPVISGPMAMKANQISTATVPTQAGCSYQWTIQGGTFTTPTTGSSVSFKAAPNTPLRLSCRLVNGAGSPGLAGSLDVPVTFTREDVLRGLGLADPPARKGADGLPLDADDHPLGKGDRPVNVQKIEEIHLVYSEADLRGSGLSKVFKKMEAAHTLDPVAGVQALPTSQEFMIPVAADTNGDGKPEVLYLGIPSKGTDHRWSPSLKTVDTVTFWQLSGVGQTPSALGSLTLQQTCDFHGVDQARAFFPEGWDDFKHMRSLRNLHQQLDLASGDLDGDGKDELVVTVKDTLYVLRVSGGAVQKLWSRTFPTWILVNPANKNEQTSGRLLRVECADLDLDGKAEILVTNGERTLGETAEFSVFTWNGTAGVAVLDALPISIQGKKLRTAEVKAGDLEGSGRPKVVLAGLTSDKRELCTMVIQVKKSAGSWTADFAGGVYKADAFRDNNQIWQWNAGGGGSDWYPDQQADAAVPGLALADLKGDGTRQIASGHSVYEYSAGKPLDFFSKEGEDLLEPQTMADCFVLGTPNPWDGIAAGANWNWRYMQTWYGQLAAGRFTKDPAGADEVLLLDQQRGKLRRFYYDKGENRMKEGATLATGGMAEYLCVADMDNDQTEVVFEKQNLYLSQPTILAALASPPYWAFEGVDQEKVQNIGNAMTQFGRNIGSSIGLGAKVGFSLSGSVGAKASVPVISNGEVEAKATATHSVDFAAEIEAGYERSLSYEAYAGQNAVLFSSVPIDFYTYRVTKAGPGSQYHVGEKVLIKQQRQALLQFTDVDYYNANNGDYPDIGSGIFKQTLGRPFTYMGLAEARLRTILEPQQTFLMEHLGSGIVPRGNLYNTMSYATSVTAGASMEYTFTYSQSLEVSFVVLLGMEAGVSVGVSIKTSTTLGESIAGSVGGLQPDYYKPENLYKWGIVGYIGMVSNTAYPLSWPFKVVNYWVEKP